jgi:CheY-like chemotaxis protein
MGMAAHSVLIVEDHDELRYAIAALLVRAGYLVRTASDAEEAVVELASMPRPCLVLWDPVSHRMSLSLVAQSCFEGIHIATIPVGIAPAAAGFDTAAGGYTKRLTSHHALMSIVRDHCSQKETV